MNTVQKISMAAAAATVAIAAASLPAQAKHAKQVACYGVNGCKGQSDCKTAHNDCKGMNGCKGQGFKKESARDCKAAGGSLRAPA